MYAAKDVCKSFEIGYNPRGMTDWISDNFHRRSYTVEGAALDEARRIEVRIFVDGKPLVQMQAREPGIMAFVSHPEAQGFSIEIVEASGVRFTDMRTPAGEQTLPLAPWQKGALGLG